MIKLLIFNLTLFSSIHLFAQISQTYAVRGIVIDAVTQSPVIGADVYITNFEDDGTVTDVDGQFQIQNLTIGRHIINVNYLGYQQYSSTIEIKSGKELVLTIALSEDINTLGEIVISAQNEKSRPTNSMAYASTRTFSVEESGKFAAAVDDPARMALSYAGVVSTDDGNNTISIRGNSPSGVLWRLEGVDIPNPNHYAQPSSSGGGISVLSAQMLSNSDFSTGAFAAEYGNALSGVFDLKFRNGNNKNTEFTLKAGVLGLEAAVEGPFSKNYNGSYLINYRYSTLSILDKMGIDLLGELNFSDLNYHINLPTKKHGTFSIFGMHGWSSQKGNETLDTLEMNAIFHRNNFEFISNMSVDGIKHSINPWKNGYLKTTVAYTQSKNFITEDQKTIYDHSSFFLKYNSLAKNNKITISSAYTHKLSSMMSIRSGFMHDVLSFKVDDNLYKDENAMPLNLINSNGNSSLFQVYSQLQFTFNEKWKSNVGVHFSSFRLNNSTSFEPRLNINYSLNDKSDLSLSYGLHSQILPLPVYFVTQDDESNGVNNKNLELNKAHHIVLSHQYEFNNYTRIKTEVYHQRLFNVPVGLNENENYSIINQQFQYPRFALINEGKGSNTGIETTVERFMQNNLYYIFTASISDSKYKTPTSKWIDSRYNTKYSFIATIGKEWTKGKNKQNIFGINIKSLLVGGQRYTPIDKEASRIEEKEILNESLAFTEKTKDYWRLDVGIKYKRNHKNWTSTLSLDIQNATSRKNVGGIEYNHETQQIEEWYLTPLLPILSYKVEF